MSKHSGYNPSSWFNNVFFREQGGNYIYSLTDPNLAGVLSSVFNGGYSESNMMTLVQSIPELMFICNAIASRTKSGNYSLQKLDGTPVTDNELWNKMVADGPNWQYKFDEFIWHAVVYRMATGNRYGFSFCPGMTMGVTPKHSNIKAMWNVPPHYMQVFMKNPRPSYLVTEKASDYIDRYCYTGGGDTMSDIKPEYITHNISMKMGDSTDIITGKGVSMFKAAEYPLSNLTAVYIARNQIYVKGGPLGAIVSAARDQGGSVALAPHEKDEVVRDLQTRFGLGRGQSPFAFTGQPVDYKKFGSSIQELEPFKETAASTAAICGIINFPTALMPKLEDPKFSNLDVGERNIYENIIFSEAESICKYLTDIGHFGEIGCKVVVSFDHISALQDDALKSAQAFKANVEGAQSAFENGHITSNEYREIIGHGPVEGGDNYIEKETDSATPVNEDESEGEKDSKNIKLSDYIISELFQIPEKSKGIKKCGIILKNGIVLKNRTIFAGTFLKLEKSEQIAADDIVAIVADKTKEAPVLFGNIKHKRKKFNFFGSNSN